MAEGGDMLGKLPATVGIAGSVIGGGGGRPHLKFRNRPVRVTAANNLALVETGIEIAAPELDGHHLAPKRILLHERVRMGV
jgi:hypothetical protein